MLPIPLRDAAVTAKLKQAGAIVLAKVNTVNWFGNGGFDELHPIGATLNPYNVAHSPGGSSNGTGASMAAWFATIGIGTDTGGSVQIPSSYNSLVGMVATQGMVSRAGIVPRGPTQDRAGPMTRSVYDTAATLSVIAGWDAEDLGTFPGMGHFPKDDWAKRLGSGSLQGRRIGVLREMFSTGPSDPEVTALFDQVIADLKKGGRADSRSRDDRHQSARSDRQRGERHDASVRTRFRRPMPTWNVWGPGARSRRSKTCSRRPATTRFTSATFAR